MIKKIRTQVLMDMLDVRMNACMCKMTNAIKDQNYKLVVDNPNCQFITWKGGHFSFKAFDTMKELKAKLQNQEEIDVDENTFSLSELVQLLKAADFSEVRSHLVDCLIARVIPSK